MQSGPLLVASLSSRNDMNEIARISSCNKIGSIKDCSEVACMPPRQPSPPILLTGRWTKQQDSILRHLVEQSSNEDEWTRAAAAMFPNRTMDDLIARWKKVLLPGFVKGTWSQSEDEKIIEMKNRGFTEWADIARVVCGRSAKQCRDRWANHLDPTIIKCEWSLEEDSELLRAHAQLGNAWTEVAKRIPGRSENAVKNRWNSAALRAIRDKHKNEETSSKRKFRLILKQPKETEETLEDSQSPEVCWIELKLNLARPLWWPAVVFSSIEALEEFDLPLPPDTLVLEDGERVAYCCGPHFTFEIISSEANIAAFVDDAASIRRYAPFEPWTSPTNLTLAVEEARLYKRILSKPKCARGSRY